MGFTAGRVTFQRFLVRGAKPRAFGPDHLERLREHMRPRVASASPHQIGWTAGKHINDTDFTEEKNIYPDHLVWDLWVQTDRLPPERLKWYYEIELKALAEHNPSGHPSARQKRAARAAAREMLEKEASDGRYRRWQLVPCCWDLGTNFVFLGSGSSSAADRFCALFEQTFEGGLFQLDKAGPLQVLTAGQIAINANSAAKHSMLSTYIPGTTPDDVAWIPAENDVSFLGNEFLLWLWFKGDTGTDTIALGDDSEATFMLSGGVKLDCPRGQAGNDTMNHEGPARLPEALRALRSGKLPRKAGLTIVRHNEQFALHLQAESFTVSACKLPKPTAEKTSARDVITSRLQSTRDIAETLDLMYRKFLESRLSPQWPMELGDMQRWLKRPERATA